MWYILWWSKMVSYLLPHWSITIEYTIKSINIPVLCPINLPVYQPVLIIDLPVNISMIMVCKSPLNGISHGKYPSDKNVIHPFISQWYIHYSMEDVLFTIHRFMEIYWITKIPWKYLNGISMKISQWYTINGDHCTYFNTNKPLKSIKLYIHPLISPLNHHWSIAGKMSACAPPLPPPTRVESKDPKKRWENTQNMVISGVLICFKGWFSWNFTAIL